MELRRVRIFTCFEKFNQEKIELGDNEASEEVMSRARSQQEENFLRKPRWLIYLWCFHVSSFFLYDGEEEPDEKNYIICSDE